MIRMIMATILLTGCSMKSDVEIGHWIDRYPSEYSIWQCVESFSPFKNKEC
jgi:hypothetical protein